MSDQVAAGWYSDPWKASAERWWDGAQWTGHVRGSTTTASEPADPSTAPPPADAATGSPAAPAVPQGSWGERTAAAPVAPTVPAAPAAWQYPGAVQTAPSTRGTGTPFVWIIAFLPLALAAGIFVFDYHGYFQLALRISQSGSATDFSTREATAYGFQIFAQLGIALLVYAVTVVLAALDARSLRRRGIDRPFSWAFAFIPAQLVYMIGRGVVVQRTAKRGLAPMFVYIACGVVWIALFIAVYVAAVAPLTAELSGSLPTT